MVMQAMQESLRPSSERAEPAKRPHRKDCRHLNSAPLPPGLWQADGTQGPRRGASGTRPKPRVQQLKSGGSRVAWLCLVLLVPGWSEAGAAC